MSWNHYNLGGRLVSESAGPNWHLIGDVKKGLPKQLTLTRPVNALSPKIRLVAGKVLPTVQITDKAGNSAILSNVRIQLSNPSLHHHSKPGAGTEEFKFFYHAIKVQYVNGGTTTNDDWTSSDS